VAARSIARRKGRRAGWNTGPRSTRVVRAPTSSTKEAHLATRDTRTVTAWSARTRRRPGLAARYWFAARVGVWMCVLAVRVRASSLPALLEDLARSRHHVGQRSALDVDTVVTVVTAVSRFPLFRTGLFPLECVRRSLALYRALTGMGHPAIIHFGIRRHGATLLGHSWVTLRGQYLDEPGPTHTFTLVYSYPPPVDAGSPPPSCMELINV
jgi:hypothetical protein